MVIDSPADKHVPAHVALGIRMHPWPEDFLEHFRPVAHRLVVHRNNDMADNGGADAFVGQGKVNVRIVAAIALKDRPYRGAHLLALHVSGVTGDT